MEKIIGKDFDNGKVTVTIHWSDLNFFIDQYERWAGHALADNDIGMAMKWAKKAQEFTDLKNEFIKDEDE
jgi:hypothetical protein